MRFIDEAKIKVSGGHGGPGCVAFRREKFIPRGGPDGGDGGDGGSVVFESTHQLSTLQDFRFKREYKAESGMHGSGSNKAGKDGESIIIKVPVGTVLKDADTGEVLYDFRKSGDQWTACKGGRGGKGNAHFATATFQAPKFAQPGLVGEFKEISLELKLIAEAGIIGFPNAGKSTLISRISAAKPKIADYAFTTLSPNLGVVYVGDFQHFTAADIPGLIEGAHLGQGLGHKFLKHIERTRVFVHLLDGAQILEDLTKPKVENPEAEALKRLAERYKVIRKELGLYSEALLHKPEIVALNKVELLAVMPDFMKKAKEVLKNAIAQERPLDPPKPNEPFFISGVTGEEIPNLVGAMAELVFSTRGPDETPVE